MSLASRIPLMKEGSTARNAIVALVYLLLSPILFTIAVLSLPFVAAYKVYTGDWSEKLSRLPGIEPGGGAVPAAVAFVYAFVIVGSVVAIAPGGDTGDSPEAQAALDGTPTVDERRTADATDTPTQTDGGADVTATDSPAPTSSPEPTATDTPDPTPTATATPEPTPTATATPEESMSEADVSAALEARGIDVVLFQRNSNEERGYILAYESPQSTQEGIAREMGTVAGAWAAFVDANGADGLGEGLIVQVREVNGDPAGYYEIKTEWAVRYNSGELTAEEYSVLILRSLEVVE